MIKKVAIFKNIPHGFHSVMEHPFSHNEYVRLSEWTEVEFVPADQGEIVAAQVEAIGRQIAEIKDEALAKVASLEAKRAELLALTHQEA